MTGSDVDAIPEGWYPDSRSETDERFWDGLAWTDNTRKSETASPSKPTRSATPNIQSSPTGASQAAQLASMGYLHAIALVVIAGVIIGLSAGIGALLSLAFDAVAAAALFFIVGGLVGIAMMIDSIVALIRANVDRDTARRNTR